MPPLALAGQFAKGFGKALLARAGQSFQEQAKPGWSIASWAMFGASFFVFIFMLAVSGGTAGELTGVNNPREETLDEGDVGTPPITGECSALVDAPGLTYSYGNDTDGVPRGAIKREVGHPPEDPVGELVPVNANMCNALISIVHASIPIRLTAVLNHHPRFVSGSNRISAHWVGNAMDIRNSEAVARYLFQNRASLGIDQIITGLWPQYNVNNGQPFDGYSVALLRAHEDHIHAGW